MELPLTSTERYGVLVVDMQRDGLEEGGAIYVAGGPAIVGKVQTVTCIARRAGWPVIHTQHVHRADLSDFGITGYFEEPSCLDGTSGMDFIDQMRPEPGDLVVQKRRYDAFQGTDLDLLLRAQNIRGLFVCGVLTDACVLSTVVHARNLDYKTWMIADALSGTTMQMHQSALAIIDSYFGQVVTADWACASINDTVRGHDVCSQ